VQSLRQAAVAVILKSLSGQPKSECLRILADCSRQIARPKLVVLPAGTIHDDLDVRGYTVTPLLIRKLRAIVRDAKRRGVAPEILSDAFVQSLANTFQLPYVVPPKPKQRPIADLNKLVARLAAAPDRASGDALRKQILEGFYGRCWPTAKVVPKEQRQDLKSLKEAEGGAMTEIPDESAIEEVAFQRVRARSLLCEAVAACAINDITCKQVRRLAERVICAQYPEARAKPKRTKAARAELRKAAGRVSHGVVG
jgi:hypothetical protein